MLQPVEGGKLCAELATVAGPEAPTGRSRAPAGRGLPEGGSRKHRRLGYSSSRARELTRRRASVGTLAAEGGSPC
jgi:hypothetical protein